MGDQTQLWPGYPIRKPWDHSSVDNSPRHIAASHVLHRPLVPRHPHNCPKTLDHKTRCSQPLYKSQQTTNHHHNPPTQAGDSKRSPPRTQTPPTAPHTTTRRTDQQCLFPQNPDRVPKDDQQPTRLHRIRTRLAPHRHQNSTVLPRKEVIQPHLPVRLPCYDFVPIASPTFDHSPRKTG
jgi:hypothetical protein